MDAYEKSTGGRVLAIPHNSNLSNGLMFELTQPGGGPMTAAYAKRRAAREPVVEITQIKGDSEAHPFMSPNDEFAGYGVAGWEKFNLLGNIATKQGDLPGSYVREALKRGLILLTCGVYSNVVRFLAPITIQDEVFNEALDKMVNKKK